jgi:hypothetical protein
MSDEPDYELCDPECDCMDEYVKEHEEKMTREDYKRLATLLQERVRELNKAVEVLRKEILYVANATQTVYVYCEDCKPKPPKVKFSDLMQNGGSSSSTDRLVDGNSSSS